MSISSRPSSVSSGHFVPSAAAVIGMVTVQCRSSPRRWKTACGSSWISTYRSPAGPPPGPTSPSPASWMRVPLSTPAGILTVSVRRERIRPSPAHSGHGVGTTVPKPWHCGHGREVMTWPRKDRVTCETSPRPRHMSQVCAEVPGAAPSPRAGRTDDGRVDLDVLGRAEGRLVEVDLQPDHRVLAAPGTRPRPALRRRAEERVHDVGEVAEATGSEAARATAARLRTAGRRRGRRPASSAGPTAPRRRR